MDRGRDRDRSSDHIRRGDADSGRGLDGDGWIVSDDLAGRYGGGIGERYEGGDRVGRDGGGYGRNYGPLPGSGWTDREDRFMATDWTAQAERSSGPYAGKGPVGYHRASERVLEDVNEVLTWEADVDARGIQVTVEGDEVTLEGTVDSRRGKRAAEDAAWEVRGVRDVHNHLRVRRAESEGDDA